MVARESDGRGCYFASVILLVVFGGDGVRVAMSDG